VVVVVVVAVSVLNDEGDLSAEAVADLCVVADLCMHRVRVVAESYESRRVVLLFNKYIKIIKIWCLYIDG
jgi:hypothetical protein